MAAKLRARAPPAGALLVAACLVLATAAAVSGARPLTPPDLQEDGARAVESPAGDIQTVVGAAVERDGGAGYQEHKFFEDVVGMLTGIKDSGPSPGAGH